MKTKAKRVRFRLKQRATSSYRLSVFRSNKHIYAQVIDDNLCKTVASFSTLVKKEEEFCLNSCEAAYHVGKRVAQVALKNGVDKVFFDRGKYKYHGRLKALAEGARAEGLLF